MRPLKTALRALIYLAAALAVSALLVIASGASPLTALKAFINGIFGNTNNFCEIFVKATPLILTGLACATAFNTGFFNIGAEGQFYAGAVAAAAVALRVPLPPFLRLIAAFAAGFIAGGLWSLIATTMKLRFGVSEIIATIMLNYIAVNFVGVAVRTFLQDPESGLPQSEKLAKELVLDRLVTGTRLHSGIIIALILAFLVWFLLNKTTYGYEMRVVGYNPRAAEVNGIPVMGSVLRASSLSGGLAGLAGVIEFLAIQKKLQEGFSADCGYTGVLIALLAANKPQLVPLVAIAYSAAQVGAASMERQAKVPSAMASILIGVIVLMVLARAWLSSRGKGGVKRV